MYQEGCYLDLLSVLISSLGTPCLSCCTCAHSWPQTVIDSVEDLHVGSVVLTLECAPESPGGCAKLQRMEPTSDSVAMGWDSRIWPPNKFLGDALAVGQEINFEHDCVRCWNSLKKHLVLSQLHLHFPPLSFPGQPSLISPTPLSSWVLTNLKILPIEQLRTSLPKVLQGPGTLASPGRNLEL